MSYKGNDHPAFLCLPIEILHLVASNLTYPDLLAFTLCHPQFRNNHIIQTSKSSRVDWLLNRAKQQLPLPLQHQCRWSSDKEFVSNPEVIEILRRRNSHLECADVFGRGRSNGHCLVIEGQRCPRLEDSMDKLRKQRWSERIGFKNLRRLRNHVMATGKNVDELLRSWQVGIIAVVIAASLRIVV